MGHRKSMKIECCYHSLINYRMFLIFQTLFDLEKKKPSNVKLRENLVQYL